MTRAKPSLLFVHGRSQERKEAVALKQEWIAAWEKGLAESDLDLPLSDDEIRIAYYGKTLYDLVGGVPDADVRDVVLRGDGDQNRQAFFEAVLREVQATAGLSDAQVRAMSADPVVERGPYDWKWVRSIVRALDEHVPGASGAIVAMATNDVYVYLRNQGIRDVIDTGVREGVSDSHPTVVVAHSLGTVVAYNVLRRDGEDRGWDVPLFMTIGSPLGVKAIRDMLRPIQRPECVGDWVNVMDPRDIVALHPLDKGHFKVRPPIENLQHVRNATPNRHGITGYLADALVARRLYDAVTAE